MTGSGVPFTHLHRLSDSTGSSSTLSHPAAPGTRVLRRRRRPRAGGHDPRAQPEASTVALAATYQRFLANAQGADGGFRNRLGTDLIWRDEPDVTDCWGRALWGLGTAAARSPQLGDEAMALFCVGATRRSPWTRAMGFAALGAAEVLSVHPDHEVARHLLADAAHVIGPLGTSAGWASSPWHWGEDRLRYANAVLPEVLIAAGDLLGEPRWVVWGLDMLEWLVGVEANGGHVSVTPACGWSLGERRPGFDQQPIEVAALADACARAHDNTGDPRWAEAAQRCAAWFAGSNDTGTVMIDSVSGGGCDGLEAGGRNENQGAESTLAMLSTLQQASRLRSSAALAGRLPVPLP